VRFIDLLSIIHIARTELNYDLNYSSWTQLHQVAEGVEIGHVRSPAFRHRDIFVLIDYRRSKLGHILNMCIPIGLEFANAS